MSQPIKVRSRFATAYDTARVLGVSSSRTRQLIAAAKEYTTRVAHRDEGTPATAVGKNRRRNAEATKRKANSKAAKSHR